LRPHALQAVTPPSTVRHCGELVAPQMRHQSGRASLRRAPPPSAASGAALPSSARAVPSGASPALSAVALARFFFGGDAEWPPSRGRCRRGASSSSPPSPAPPQLG